MLTLCPGQGPGGVHASESTLDADIIRRLVGAGGDVDAEDTGGHTALNAAAFAKVETAAAALIALGAAPGRADARGYTPLHLAALHGLTAIVRLLLEHGVDPNLQTTAGFTPLDGAREAGAPEIEELLRARGAWRTRDAAGGAAEWIAKGDGELSRGDLEEALASYDRALEEHPRSVSAWLHKGDALSRWTRWNGAAVECYDRGIAIDPRYSGGMLWGNRGIALTELGRVDEAVESFERVLAINPRDARAHTNIGTIRHHQGRDGEAAACYRAALEVDPLLRAGASVSPRRHGQGGPVRRIVRTVRRTQCLTPAADLVHARR